MIKDIVVKILEWGKSPKNKIRIFYFLITIVVAFLSLFCYIFVFLWPEINKKHTPEEIVLSDKGQKETLTTYSYYLDYSPSMHGYMNTEKGIMDALANVLINMNKEKNEISYYYCTDEVLPLDSTSFNIYMSNSYEIEKLYTRAISSGTQDKVLKGLDLSKIFSNFSADSNIKNDELNIIITDFNFYNDISDNNFHDQRMKAFTEGLGNASLNSNIAIYQFPCTYEGIGIDDVNFDKIYEETDNASLFLIIFSENNEAYNDYTERLELYLKLDGLKEYNKLEIKKDIWKYNNMLIVDDNALYSNTTSKINFNFNNKYIENRKDNEIGLYITGHNIKYAIFQGNVVSLDIDVFTQGNPGLIVNSKIDTKVKILYPYGIFNTLREYEGNSPLKVSNTEIVWDNNQKNYYLRLGIECDTSIILPRSRILNKDYYVAEIQFYISDLDYIIPEWVTNLEMEENTISLDKKRGITNFVENLIIKKRIKYSEDPEHNKFMGTLILYICY